VVIRVASVAFAGGGYFQVAKGFTLERVVGKVFYLIRVEKSCLQENILF